LLNSLFHSLLKLVVIASALVVVTGVLLVGLCAALLTVVWSLLTGRRPAAYTTFMRFRHATRPFQNGGWPGRARPAPGSQADNQHSDIHADIVDVQAHEVRGTISDQR
jgi:xanthosine utilization system XapX-like protein